MPGHSVPDINLTLLLSHCVFISHHLALPASLFCLDHHVSHITAPHTSCLRQVQPQMASAAHVPHLVTTSVRPTTQVCPAHATIQPLCQLCSKHFLTTDQPRPSSTIRYRSSPYGCIGTSSFCCRGASPYGGSKSFRPNNNGNCCWRPA